MTTFITVPGIGGSGEAHWQSRWEAGDPDFRRFGPASWDMPDLQDWIAALDRAVAAAPPAPVLVAHSLGCLAVAHWAGRAAIAGAFLVAPPDPAGACFPPAAAGFAAVPDARLPFPALVVASSDDPYAAPTYARDQARAWSAALVEAGALGHVNAASGLGDWPAGHALLDRFVAGLAA